MSHDSVISTLGRRAGKAVDKALLPGERVRAGVDGRENKALILTGARLIIVDGRGWPFGGNDAVDLSDVMRISSGHTAVSIEMRNGNQYSFDIWPTKRTAAHDFVQAVRQARTGATPSPAPQAPGGIADELAKLAQLRQQGLLSDQEFQAQKARLLT